MIKIMDANVGKLKLADFQSPNRLDDLDRELREIIAAERDWKNPPQSYYDFKKKNPMEVALMRAGLWAIKRQ